MCFHAAGIQKNAQMGAVYHYFYIENTIKNLGNPSNDSQLEGITLLTSDTQLS